MKWRKIARWLAGLLVAAFASLVAANAYDYFRFQAIIRQLENIPDVEWRAMGDAAARVTEAYRGTSAPGFELLGALSVNLRPGFSDFLLYELKPSGEQDSDYGIHLYVRISTSPNNQEIIYFTNSDGGQTSRVLWNRNSEFVRRHSPGDRLLTVTEWAGREGRSWIILEDRILVVDKTSVVGGEDSIAGSAPLEAGGRARISDAIRALGPDVRGKLYDGGALDGRTLEISFAPDGSARPDSVSISNTWVEEFGPLLSAVSELGPSNCPIEFIEAMTSRKLNRPRHMVLTWEEARERESRHLALPWWCVWRRCLY